ncbi:histidine kinase [Streptomyces sp. NPDC006334]|uniref:sensor histidine kinase n=1 Tax=Streptomyces sp. NPDC006334 TaxID=3156754 RepID=UPI0033A1C189
MERDTTRSRTLVLTVMSAVTIAWCLYASDSALRHPWEGSAIGAVIVWGVLGGLQILHCRRVLHGSPASHSAVSLTVQAVLTFASLAVLGGSGAGAWGMLAGSVITVARRGVARCLAVGVAAAQGCLMYLHGVQPRAALMSLLVGASVAVTFAGIAQLSSLVARLHQARLDAAQLAVIGERLRFAQDLHDIVGYSLSAAVTKAELALRLGEREPAAARTELAQAIAVTRDAQQEIRSIARGHHQLSLQREFESARSVLRSAGVEPRFSALGVDFCHRAGSELAAVLREGVSNVLRHSGARYCVVRVSQDDGAARLVVINDRPHPVAVDHELTRGVGLDSLSQRMATLGGNLTTVRRGCGESAEFVLEAVVPLAVGTRRTEAGTGGGRAHPRVGAGAVGAVPVRSRLVAWAVSNPALLHRDPDGVDTVPRP